MTREAESAESLLPQALALRMLGAPSAMPITPALILAGQAAVGNRAVQRLLHAQREAAAHGHGCTCAGCARGDAAEVAQREDAHSHGCTCAGCARSDATEAAPPLVQREADAHGHGCTCAGCARSDATTLVSRSARAELVQRNGDSDDEYIDDGGPQYQSDLCDGTGLLLPAYRTRVRRYFYPSGFNVGTHAWKDQQLTAMKVKLKGKIGKTRYKCPICKQAKAKGEMSIDHKMPVSQHWNNTGHDQTQVQRRSWYNNTANHKVVCKSCNSSKGGTQYIPTVGPNFRGPPDHEANPLQ